MKRQTQQRRRRYSAVSGSEAAAGACSMEPAGLLFSKEKAEKKPVSLSRLFTRVITSIDLRV